MGRRHALAGAMLVFVAGSLSACDSLSCWADLPAGGGTVVPAPARTTVPGSTTTPPTTASTTASATAATTGPTPATTASTAPAGPLDIYKAEMKAWKNRYAAEMEKDYNLLSAMKNPLAPTEEQVRAARTLADLMDGLVAELEAIQAPPELAAAHSAYAASLEHMHRGVDRLAQGLEHGGFTGSIDVARAFATIYAADKDGQDPRTTLEQALGFSLTSAD